MKKTKVLIVGGGSGGHFFPSLAVLEKIREIDKKSECLFVGLKGGKEKSRIEKRKVDTKVCEVKSGKLRRYFSFQNFSDFFKFLYGIYESLKIIKAFKPNVIFSSGGFVSLPIILAGKIKKIPIVVHECDTEAGLANKISSFFSNKVTCSFEKTFKKFKKKGIFTGHPIRKEIFKGNKQKGLAFLKFKDSLPTLLIWGGSQGSSAINSILEKTRKELSKKIQIIHIGAKKEKKEPNYKSFVFLNEQLPDVLSCADLVLGRSGANSIFECAARGKPQILIPLPSSANQHQQKNALEFLKKEAALILDEKLLEPEIFIKIIKGIILYPEKLKKMSKKTKDLVGKNSAKDIAKIVLGNAKK